LETIHIQPCLGTERLYMFQTLG